MLVWHKIKTGKFKGHYYQREEAPYMFPDTWWYDKFGRGPVLGDFFVYTTTDSNDQHHIHFGVICYESVLVLRRDPITHEVTWKVEILHYSPLRSSPIPRKGEKLVGTLENGLSMFSPFYELKQVRSENGIILLKPNIFTRAFPHLS